MVIDLFRRCIQNYNSNQRTKESINELIQKAHMKILNLYACLGGNRYKWDEVAEDLEITAIELDEELAKLYQERFPNDKVISGRCTPIFT